MCPASFIRQCVCMLQALANAMLAIVSHEALAAQLRGHPPTFEMLRAFQVQHATTVVAQLDQGVGCCA